MLKTAFWVVVLSVCIYPLQASALQIVYPSDGTWFERSDYLVLKGGRDDITGMTVAINGAKSGLIDVSGKQYKQYFRDILILQPQFVPGRNAIKVEAYVGPKVVATSEASVYYLDGDPTATPPEGFEPFVMHVEEREAICAPCHEMNPDRVQLKMTSAEKNPCAGCHKRMLDKKHVHGPASVFECLYCHNGGEGRGRYPARDGEAALCNECHMDIIETFNANKHVHGPVEVGLCTLCHESHGTDYRFQLLAPVNDLCYGCHESVAEDQTHVVRGVGGAPHPLEGVPDPSQAGEELTCVSCHNPHGGQSWQFFRQGATSAFSLCVLCHEK